jgi:bifunctional DNA primase/polymerase-like protein
MSKNLAAALELAASGIPVFPALVSWNAKAGKLDKKPAITDWQTKATADAEQIKASWQHFPVLCPRSSSGALAWSS